MQEDQRGSNSVLLSYDVTFSLNQSKLQLNLTASDTKYIL